MKEILESRSGSLDSFVPSPGSAQSNPRLLPQSEQVYGTIALHVNNFKGCPQVLTSIYMEEVCCLSLSAKVAESHSNCLHKNFYWSIIDKWASPEY